MRTTTIARSGLTLAALLALLGAVLFGAATPARADTPDAGRLVLVLDASSSMLEADAGGQTRIDAARQALGTVISALKPNEQVGLRVFGATVAGLDNPAACTDSQLKVPIGADNRAALQDAVGAYAPYGETPIGYALQEAGKDLGGEGKRTIVLVSDGESNCDPQPCDVATQLRGSGIDLVINVVGLNVNAAARDQLKCIAAAGGGDYFDAADAGSLAGAMTTLATRAFRPFAISGTPITGGTNERDAVDVTVGGQYTDTVAEHGAARTYRIEWTIPGSSLMVSATGRPADPSVRGQIQVALTTPDGTSCETEFAMSSNHETWALLTATTWVTGYTNAEECRTSDALIATISATDWGESAGVPIEIRVAEEAPLAKGQTLPDSRDADADWTLTGPSDGSGGTITAGSSFNDATLVQPGTYRADIVPGEVQYLKVPADWGQQVRVRWQLDQPAAQQEQAISRSAARLKVDVFDPHRADSGDIFSKDADGNSYTSALYGDRPSVAAASSYPIAYANRDKSDVPASDAGEYYISLAADRVEGMASVLPYTLTIELVGTPGEGKPTFEEIAATPSPSASPAETDTTSPAAASSSDPRAAGDETEGSPSPLLIGGLALAGVAAVGAGAVGLVRWRRG